ncbi:hypothetical protein N657DRAFT_601025, partial [Parathielavia appendiculata]
MRESNTLMRLRLVVRRHALPEVRVVFVVQLDTDPTIVNLLEQVNEIVPLESNDWGLEDYAVELRDSSGHAFDCLHFQQVSLVLNNDEQVFIRPLDIGDRRKRRLSGRDQITADGRHLIDGVPFGRPRLRGPRDRPPIDIPPLKRRRITFEADEEDDEEPRFLLTEHGEDDRSDRRVRIRAAFDDVERDGSEGDEDDADDDFVDEDSDEDEGDEAIEGGIDGSDLEAELRDLQEDIEEDDEELQDTASIQPNSTHKNTQPSASGVVARLDLETLDKITALRAAFPSVPADACERALNQQQGSTKLAYLRLRTQHQPAMPLDAILSYVGSSPPKATATENAASDESEAESVASMVKHYDQHGFPSGSILAGTAASQTAEAMRKSGHSVKVPVHTKFDDIVAVPAKKVSLSPSFGERDSSGESDSESESDNGSEGDSDNDSGPEVASSKMAEASGSARFFGGRGLPSSSEGEDETGEERGSDRSSEDEATSSDSDDSEEVDESASHGSDGGSDSDDDSSFNDDTDDSNKGRGQEAGGSADSSASSDEADSSNDDESSDDSAEEAPQTRSVNAEVITAMEPPATQDQDAQEPQLDATPPELKSGSAETPRPVPPGQGKRSTQKRNARRKAARMAQKAAGGGEPLPPTAVPLPAAETLELLESVAAKKAALLRRFGEVHELISQEAKEATVNDREQDSAPSNAPVVEKSTRMDGTRPLNNHTPLNSVDGHPRRFDDQPEEQADPEAWRKKIAYRAVECCQEGIKLSEPPFPFVQRWDPQQQFVHRDGNNRGGRSKRKQRNREEFLEGSRASTKRQKYGNSMDYDGDGESYANDTTGYKETILNYDEESPETREQPEQTSVHPADEEEDLPPLPTDVSTLPKLRPGDAVAGMIVSWKQLLLSKATNWQPQVSTLTGIVVDVLGGNTLEVRLAKRDRNIDRSERVYDDDGHRVYDKFEVPDMDDEDDEAAEQGYRTLELADMIEPRVLQAAPGVVEVAPSPKEPSVPGQRDMMRDAVQHEERSSKDKVSTTPDQTQAGPHETDTQDMDVDTYGGGGQSIVSETPVARKPDASISEDRRHEFSLRINDAGFRKDVDPSVTTFPNSAGLDLSSPSRQLEEMSHDATTIIGSQAAQSQSQASPQLPSQTTLNNVDSQPIYLEPFHRLSDPISDPHDGHDERREAYTALDVLPSETASPHSGRQVDPAFSIELGTGDDPFPDMDDPALVSRSTLGRHSDIGENPAVPKKEHDNDTGSKSDSSFASLSDPWKEASTNGSFKSPTESAVMSALKVRKPDVTPDLEYEEAM